MINLVSRYQALELTVALAVSSRKVPAKIARRRRITRSDSERSS